VAWKRKTKQTYHWKKPAKIHSGIIFWSVFGLFIIALFGFSWKQIGKTIAEAGLPGRFSQWFSDRDEETLLPQPQAPAPVQPSPAVAPVTPPAVVAAEPIAAPTITAEPVIQPIPVDTPNIPPAATQTHTLYFIKVDQNGDIHRVPVKRSFPATTSPLTDALNGLLVGLTAEEEQQQDIISLIPASAKIISASIQQGTAYLSFNEDFLYSPYGVDGYAGQLKQVIWTATEFSTVKNVQILINGRKESYLGDSIWIGAPLNRDSFSSF
jgi:hypothetical protein